MPAILPSLKILGIEADPTQLPTPTPAPGKAFFLAEVDGFTSDQETKLLAAATELGHDIEGGQFTISQGLHVLGTAGLIDPTIASKLQAVDPALEAYFSQKSHGFFDSVQLAMAIYSLFAH